MNGMNNTGYIPNGGQTFYPPKYRPEVPTLPYTPCPRVKGIWTPEIHPKFAGEGFVLIGEPLVEELEGLTLVLGQHGEVLLPLGAGRSCGLCVGSLASRGRVRGLLRADLRV